MKQDDSNMISDEGADGPHAVALNVLAALQALLSRFPICERLSDSLAAPLLTLSALRVKLQSHLLSGNDDDLLLCFSEVDAVVQSIGDKTMAELLKLLPDVK